MNNIQYDKLKQHSSESNAFVKGCLKTALLSLMKEKSYKELSVAELCRKAGVSRMAFYRNYQVINDLVHEAAVDLNQTILQKIGSPFRSGTSEQWYKTAFQNIKEHQQEMSIMFQENFQFEWMKIVNGLALHDQSFSEQKSYQRLCWCGGFENVVSVWLNNGMKESPEEMARYCVRYLPHTPLEEHTQK